MQRFKGPSQSCANRGRLGTEEEELRRAFEDGKGRFGLAPGGSESPTLKGLPDCEVALRVCDPNCRPAFGTQGDQLRHPDRHDVPPDCRKKQVVLREVLLPGRHTWDHALCTSVRAGMTRIQACEGSSAEPPASPGRATPSTSARCSSSGRRVLSRPPAPRTGSARWRSQGHQ